MRIRYGTPVRRVPPFGPSTGQLLRAFFPSAESVRRSRFLIAVCRTHELYLRRPDGGRQFAALRSRSLQGQAAHKDRAGSNVRQLRFALRSPRRSSTRTSWGRRSLHSARSHDAAREASGRVERPSADYLPPLEGPQRRATARPVATAESIKPTRHCSPVRVSKAVLSLIGKSQVAARYARTKSKGSYVVNSAHAAITM